jgi:hypothetical protein
MKRVYAKDQTLAGKEVRRPGRRYEIKVRDFTGAEQGVPIRLFAGTVLCAGVYITPVFNLKAKEVEQEGGK